MRTTLSKSILAASLMLVMSFMSSTAGALVKGATADGCSTIDKLYHINGCSVFITGLLVGLGNTTRTEVAFTVTMFNISGQVFCFNPALNTLQGQGQPFFNVAVDAVGTNAIDLEHLSKNGKTTSEIAFHDPDIIAALEAAGITVECVNPNWFPFVVVTEMEILGQQWSDPDTATETATMPDSTACFLTPEAGENFVIDGSCDLDDTLRRACTIESPYDTDPAAAFTVPSYTYDCTTICHDADPTVCSLTTP